jgi:hypothetical protein
MTSPAKLRRTKQRSPKGIVDFVPSLIEESKESIKGKQDDQSISSKSSISTLFSEDFDLSDESVSKPNKTETYRHLRKNFAKRKKLLEKITRGKSPDSPYVRMLWENEQLVEEAAFLMLREKDQAKRSPEKIFLRLTDLTSDTKTPTTGPSLAPRQQLSFPPGAKKQQEWSRISSFRRLLLFEVNHTLPGYLNLSLYCLAHGSIASLFTLAIGELLKYLNKGETVEDLIYLILLSLGLVLSRASGSIWIDYVNSQTYSCIKFDMHNRLRLGDPDARRLRWLRKHKFFQALLDLVGFYLCLSAIGHFQDNRLLKLFDIRDKIFEELPSAPFPSIVTPEKEKLWYGTDNYDSYTQYLEDRQDFDDMAKYTLADEKYLESILSVDSFASLLGSEDNPCVDSVTHFAFFAVCAFVPIVIMTKYMRYKFEIH